MTPEIKRTAPQDTIKKPVDEPKAPGTGKSNPYPQPKNNPYPTK